MIQELRLLDTPFGIDLTQAVEERVNDRRTQRQMELSTLLAYLENPKFLATINDCVLEYASRNDIARTAADLYRRMFLKSPFASGAGEENRESSVDAGPTPPKRRFSQKLQEGIDERKGQHDKTFMKSSVSSTTNLVNDIKKDFKKYELSGQLTDPLEKVMSQKIFLRNIFFI